MTFCYYQALKGYDGLDTLKEVKLGQKRYNTKTYSEPNRTSKMELFARQVNNFSSTQVKFHKADHLEQRKK